MKKIIIVALSLSALSFWGCSEFMKEVKKDTTSQKAKESATKSKSSSNTKKSPSSGSSTNSDESVFGPK